MIPPTAISDSKVFDDRNADEEERCLRTGDG